MKDYKKLLVAFVEVITFLFASFGGFLKKIAPPDQVDASYPVGIMSFLMLIILLAISALGHRQVVKTTFRKWMSAGALFFVLTLPACFLYPYMVSHYTYPQHSQLDKRRLSASDDYLTPDARQYKATNPNATPEELDRNLPDGDVWTSAGIERTESRLLVIYAWLVLSLSGAIFCLLEANLGIESHENAKMTAASK